MRPDEHRPADGDRAPLASLRDYILVSQGKPQIELYQRTSGDTWSYRAFGPGERAVLTSGAEIDVDTIFDGVMALPGDEAPTAL